MKKLQLEIKPMKFIKFFVVGSFITLLACLWIPLKLTTVLLEPLIDILNGVCRTMDEIFELAGRTLENIWDGK